MDPEIEVVAFSSGLTAAGGALPALFFRSFPVQWGRPLTNR
ncbi:MAG: hypothetical protein P4K78_01475 [Terracidiphilus sp.]|nr:hypothetical protein [Terracidiphilus sp.]